MKQLSVLLVAFALMAAACGGAEVDPVASDEGVPETTATTATPKATTTVPSESTTAEVLDDGFPITISDGMGEVTIESKPTAIVSLSPASTEILFAVGAGDQILAVDSLSNYPAEAPLNPDLSAWTPNVEAIIGMNPDLVVISGDTGDLIAGLNAAGIPVVTHFAAASLDDVYAQIEQVGAMTGNLGGAAEVVSQMQADITEIASSVPDFVVAPTYYHELDDTLYSITSQTFIGQMYALLGLENIADPADEDGSAYGYPQLSAEYLVDADPDFIFLGDTKCCAVTAESVSGRAGWDTLSAVQNSRVIELDDDVASRWGPRVVELLRTVAEAMTAAEISGG